MGRRSSIAKNGWGTQGKPPKEALALTVHADFGLLRQLDKALALEADTKMEGASSSD